MEVRPREAAEDLFARRRVEAELDADLAPHFGSRGGGAREDARRTDSLEQRSDAEIIGAKVVPPLRDAVRFVDGDEVELHLAEQLDERVRRQALGGRVDELVAPAQHPRLAVAAHLRVERGREERRLDPALRKRADLILHQRDERREDERRPFEKRSRKLVGERLSTARRRHDEHTPGRAEKRLDRLTLPRAKRGEIEALAKECVEIGHRGVCSNSTPSRLRYSAEHAERFSAFWAARPHAVSFSIPPEAARGARSVRTMTPLSIRELEALARDTLDTNAFDYYASGSHDEITLRENVAAFERLRLHYRVLVDVSRRDASTTVLGSPVSMPVLVAPTAFHKMAHADGECGTARAAGAQGTVMILSSLANTAVEEVVAAATGPVWFQLYVYKDRKATEAVVARAEAAGCKALVLTVDAPFLGTRERDVRNRFSLPEGLDVKNMLPAGYAALKKQSSDSGLAAYVAELLDPSLSWKDLAWLRAITKLPLVLKGIVREDDARRAVDAGVAGIVVSNHGGRQLDTSPATIDVLPRIAAAVAGRCEIYVDGGVRRGTDVLKAVALGAKAVLIGRPVLWGLSFDGARGVELVLDMIRRELDLAMALAGCPSVAQMTPDLVGR